MPGPAATTILRIPLRVTNVYLIPCQGGYLQVDTGYERDYPAYLKGLQKAGVDLSQIKYLFLTHHHDDHAGFLNPLVAATRLTIIANRNARAPLLGGKNDASQGAGFVTPMVKFILTLMKKLDPQWTFQFPPFQLRDQDICVDGDDREILRKIGVAGDILYTPGHCLDHQVLLLEDGSAICGDAASSIFLFAGTHYATIVMSNMETAYLSWQKLLDAGVQTLYPSHGNPFPAARLRENMGKIKTQDLIPVS